MSIRNKIAIGLNKLARWICEDVELGNYDGKEPVKFNRFIEINEADIDIIKLSCIAPDKFPKDAIKRNAIRKHCDKLTPYMEYKGHFEVPGDRGRYEYLFDLPVFREVE